MISFKDNASNFALQMTVINGISVAQVPLLEASYVDPAKPPPVSFPSAGAYTKLVQYVYRYPMRWSGLQVFSSESGSVLLDSLVLTVNRTNVFGRSESNSLSMASLASPEDFQANRRETEMNEILDGFTTLSLASAVNNSGSTVIFTLNFFVDLRTDLGPKRLIDLPGVIR